jgi:MoaA/NifB/PqqE/SkfB family radical SAM enzyme
MTSPDNKILNYKNTNGFPPTVCIQLLDWCNLTCVNCRSDSSPRNKSRLNIGALKSFLSQLSQAGLWRISLTGGEPFYFPQLEELIAYIHSLSFPFSITTNGFSSKEKFEKVKSYFGDNGTLYVSIDGNKEWHNSVRGKKSYENAIDFLKYVRPQVTKLFVNTVLFSRPQLWAAELYHELETIGINNWTIISPVQKGRWEKPEDSCGDFQSAYSYIKNIATGKTTTSFLDFAKTDSLLTDIIFVDSDNTVRLPGYFENAPDQRKPISKKISLNDNDIVSQIISSVNNFISSENYML